MAEVDRELSSFLAIKGPLVEETYRAFRDWDLSVSAKENLKLIKETNSIGASSNAWLRDVLFVLSRRYDLDAGDKTLIQFAQSGVSLDEWRAAQLWHIARHDKLLRIFIGDWLYDKREKDFAVLTAEAAKEFLFKALEVQFNGKCDWSPTTIARVASRLLTTATEFHLLRGKTKREFVAYHLPERSFIYLLCAMMERESSTTRVIHSPDWRLFLMTVQAVEDELLRLHQYGKLRFERAGSLLELTLPYSDTAECVRSLAS
ncbi:MAG: DUF1819 family protein [Bdellovibrionales bacterium]|nr:DUF1819 family protein [Bdellovibrionales bacterium]